MAVSVMIFCAILLAHGAKSSNTTIESETNPFAQFLVKAIVLPYTQVEILGNSLGIHTSLTGQSSNDTEVVDREYHVMAASATDLWSDLRTTQNAQNVFVKTLETFLKEVNYNSHKNTSHWNILTDLDEAYIRDPILGAKYASIKKKNERFLKPAPDLKTITEQQKMEIIRKELGPRLMLFRFLQAAVNSNKKYDTVAHSYYTLARDEKQYEKVQNIFDQVLKDVANTSLELGTDEQTKNLYTTLKDGINNDANLKNILEQKKIVLPDKF